MKKTILAGFCALMCIGFHSCTSDEDNLESNTKKNSEILSVKEGPDDDPINVKPPKK
ncbi:hypothetical protein ACFFLS_23945 [Flavobacterium procerum]|uniref:Lipoprotein n=1 Tax=Flavobacterium procerum TaxID=1455569 RepID=A0ABV6BXF2_9FLAO